MPHESRLRRSPRYLVDLPVFCKYTPKGAQATKAGSGWAHILRDTGACLELTGAVAPGTALGLVLQTASDSLSLEAVVVWEGYPSLPEGRTLHSVTFLDLTAVQRMALRRLIRKEGLRWARAQRPPIILSVRCQPQGTAGPRCQGWIGDLSRKGCLLLLPERLPVGTVIEIAIATPRGDVAATVNAVSLLSSERDAPGQLVRHRVWFTDSNRLRDMVIGFVLRGISTSAPPWATAG